MQVNKKNALFTILHFNDVYDIQPNKKDRFGIVNFEAYLQRLRKKYPENLLLFSGDCFSPSILTHIYEGQHMVKALNMIGIDAACYGNHQFDLESNKTEKLAQDCNFPWLLGNIRFKGTEFILGNGKTHIYKHSFGIKIGIFGIAGQDWLGILSEQYENQLQYDQVGQYSRKMCKFLRQEQKCDMIIALTHMRVYQDKKLPLLAPDIDIILGGHDHVIMKQFINQIPTLKSGDNFKFIGVINVYQKNKSQSAQYKGRRFDFDIQIQEIPNQTDSSFINTSLKNHVDQCMERYRKSDHLVGYTDVPLQTRFTEVRSKETNYGNFLVDLTRAYYDTDCCILNAGSIRNDLIIPVGQLRYSVISNLINSPMVVKQIKGSVLLKTLQFSVSGLPGYPGSFLSVSGIKFRYNLSKTPRVQYVQISGKQLDLTKDYSMACNLYIGTGGDGFQMLKNCKMIVDPIAAIDLVRLILKFFKGTYQLKGQQKISQIYQKRQVKNQGQNQLLELPQQIANLSRNISSKSKRIQQMKNKYIESQLGQKFVCISPITDGRIKQQTSVIEQ